MTAPRLSATAYELLDAVDRTVLAAGQGWGWYLPEAPGVFRAKRRLEQLGYVAVGSAAGRPLVVTAAGRERLSGRGVAA